MSRLSRTPPPPKTRKDAYRDKYDASKIGGESFFPDTIARDAIVALLVVGAVFALAIMFPAHSEPPADPASTTYNPRPEWFFLFFFQFLKLFPGSLEPVAAAIIPALALLILIFVPFLDRNPERRLAMRKRTVGIGSVALVFLVVLEVFGAMSAPAVPAGEESPLIQAGRDVYKQLNCAYCHSINEVGGAIGPDLSNTGATWDKETLITYLHNPDSMIPDTLHPKLLFTAEETEGLATYLLTLGAPVEFSERAVRLFEQHCSQCHVVNGVGGPLGPDLSSVGSRRSISFLEAFTRDPGSVISGSTMPAFRRTLSEEEIRDIAAYMYSLK
jgi:mono/diheme cytochrome c family protein